VSLLYIGSDLHWGNCSQRDDFADHRSVFVDSLNNIPSTAKIVLLGDIIDVWSYKNIFNIVSCYKSCLNTLMKRDFVYYIRGNHDPDIENLTSILPSNFICLDRMIIDRMYLCHGHEFDLFNSRWNKIGKFITYLGQLIGLANPTLEDILKSLVCKIQQKGKYTNHYRFVQWAESFIQYFSPVNMIVCGHTHKFNHSRILNNKFYHNCGTWIEDGWNVFKDGQFLGNVH